MRKSILSSKPLRPHSCGSGREVCRLRRSCSPPHQSGEQSTHWHFSWQQASQPGGCSPLGSGCVSQEKGSARASSVIAKALVVTNGRSYFPALLQVVELKPAFRNILLWILVSLPCLHIAEIPCCHRQYGTGRVR